MSLRIGINPLTWTNDDLPELGRETPLETCLSEARLAGYAGIELGHKFPRTATELAPIMKRAGLRVVSGWHSSHLLERDFDAEAAELEPHLELLYAMGSRVVVLCETTGAVHGDGATPLSLRPRLDERGWARLIHGLDELGALCASWGIRLAYHHHMGTVVQTAQEIDRLMACTGPDVWLTLDTGHLTYAGADPAAVARLHGDRVAHLHLKDVRQPQLAKALVNDVPFLSAVLEGVFTVPGDGCVDFDAVLAELSLYRYTGWTVVEAEQDPKKAHPLTYATLGHKNTVAALERAALKVGDLPQAGARSTA
ncbi:MAG: myo-inosose-2 dehydratase [Archangiaceae bacterium]|nr:myo-inosose-2 dehydratase [Archangiaceae bacterium]